MADERPTYVRTSKAQGPNLERVPGPWHSVHEESTGITWCGRFPGRLMSAWRTPRVPHEGEALCVECERAKAQGQPRAYRRR